MTGPDAMAPQGRARGPQPWVLAVLGAWAALCVIAFVFGLGNLKARMFVDPDDILRLVQVRDLIGGQGWYDLHQYRIDPPQGTSMHWSRLVDLPIAAVILLVRPLLGQAAAETAALAAIPLLTLLVILFAIGASARRLFRTEVVALSCLLVGFLPVFFAQLRLLRIDHHGWQIAAVAVALLALLAPTARYGGRLAGLVLAAGLAISIELLPFTAGFAAVLFLRWWRDPEERWWLVHFMTSLALGLALFFLATRGPGALAPWCDAIAPAHVLFFLVTAGGTLVLAQAPGVARPALLALFAATGAAGALLFASLAPNCIGAPFGELDPLVYDHWYKNVLEGRPFWDQRLVAAVPVVLQALFAFAVAVHLWRKADASLRAFWRDYLLLFLVALAGGLLVWRSMSFVAVFSAIPLGWLADGMIRRIQLSRSPLAKVGIAAALIAVILPAIPAAFAKGVLDPAPPANANGSGALDTCAINREARLLGKLPPQVVFAQLDIGPSLLEQTGHAVIATGHHRANLAMRDVIRAFLSPPGEARAIVSAHRATLLAICTPLPESDNYAKAAKAGLMAQLRAGKVPAWLERIDLGTSDTLRVYRVK